MQKITLIATATFGMEAVVAREVRALGYDDLTVENGKVIFRADLSAIARCNLWLRTADRVRILIGEFPALSFNELFERAKALPWADWLPVNAAFPVEGKAVRSKLMSVSDCQAIVKKAVADSLQQHYHRDWFEENGPVYKIEISVLHDIATLTIDSSGEGLHKRGYRSLIGTAPLKETMAAGLLQLTVWKPERMLADPFCGSGTIPIEAALLGMNIAPGINRTFACEKWPVIPRQIWREARAETHDLARLDQKLEIIGTDCDDRVLKIARRNAREADVENKIHFQKIDVKQWRSSKKYGVIICNPPYGERLNEREEIKTLYKDMAQVFGQYETWSKYILTSYRGLEKAMGRPADKRRKLYNGGLEVNYYQYFGPAPPRKAKSIISNKTIDKTDNK